MIACHIPLIIWKCSLTCKAVLRPILIWHVTGMKTNICVIGFCFLKFALQVNTSMLREMNVASLAQTIARHLTTDSLSADVTQGTTGQPKIPRTCLARVSSSYFSACKLSSGMWHIVFWYICTNVLKDKLPTSSD